MNYRHEYHAGNFGDVIKHAVLARLVEYLKRKQGAFRVFDLHGGAGRYDLSSVAASKTGEWMSGIGRMMHANFKGEAQTLLEPYLDIVRAYWAGGRLESYPGSPAIIRALLRRQDRLSAYELHPEEYAKLSALFVGDIQVRVNLLDGWLVPKSHLPPKEGRGLVLIDPPFEKEGEFGRMAEALANGHRRWPGGMFALWYPLKHERETEEFLGAMRDSGIPDLVALEAWRRPTLSTPGFRGCGLVIKNPPFVLERELEAMMPAVMSVLGDSQAGWRFDRLTSE
jgi:23S rRNA (adenine2030-N6)-methyltransferase